MWDHCARSGEYGYFQGTTACLSALYSAGRHDKLMSVIAKSQYRHKSWYNRVWGAKALAAAGKRVETIQYAEDTKGLNAPLTAIAALCEAVLLDRRRAGSVCGRDGGGRHCGLDEAEVKAEAKKLIAGSGTRGNFVLRVLTRQLAE